MSLRPFDASSVSRKPSSSRQPSLSRLPTRQPPTMAGVNRGSTLTQGSTLYRSASVSRSAAPKKNFQAEAEEHKAKVYDLQQQLKHEQVEKAETMREGEEMRHRLMQLQTLLAEKETEVRRLHNELVDSKVGWMSVDGIQLMHYRARSGQ